MIEHNKNLIRPKNGTDIYVNIKDIIKKNGINVFPVPYLMKSHEYTFFQYGGGSSGKSNPNYLLSKNNVINLYYDTKDEEVQKLKHIGQLFKRELFDTTN